MSRSRKRNPVWKDKNDKYYKRLANKRARKASLPSGNAYRKVSNPYDICDYRFYSKRKEETGIVTRK